MCREGVLVQPGCAWMVAIRDFSEGMTSVGLCRMCRSLLGDLGGERPTCAEVGRPGTALWTLPNPPALQLPSTTITRLALPLALAWGQGDSISSARKPRTEVTGATGLCPGPAPVPGLANSHMTVVIPHPRRPHRRVDREQLFFSPAPVTAETKPTLAARHPLSSRPLCLNKPAHS